LAETVVIVGATGLFGGHLARQLIADGGYDVVCCGRDEARLQAFCATHGGRWHRFDRGRPDDTRAMLTALQPFAVVDTAGPFQEYGEDPYAFAAAVIGAGSHYLDIADAARFVRDITELDSRAREMGVVAVSGASSTPALSAAAVDALAPGLARIDEIETAILPGNRTPRGLSVMQAILGQVGQPMTVWRNSRWQPARGWGDTRRLDVHVPGRPEVRGRPAALVNTPDLLLFPDRYGAATVTFRAGLEVEAFHYALAAASRLVGWNVVRSLLPMSRPALHIASWLQNLGSDYGGMTVRVTGSTADGVREQRVWNLIAPDGQGPKIPVQPVVVMLEAIRAGSVAPGARPCVGIVPLASLEAKLHALGIATAREVRPIVPLFRRVLGRNFDRMPASLRALHSHHGEARYQGLADIDGPDGLMAQVASWIAGFPPAGRDVPVRVDIAADPDRETWTRTFATRSFKSLLTPAQDGRHVFEQFGPLSFRLALAVQNGELLYPVASGRAFGLVPIPRFLLPESITRELEDSNGCFRFDVRVQLRSGRRIVHYRGRLERSPSSGSP